MSDLSEEKKRKKDKKEKKAKKEKKKEKSGLGTSSGASRRFGNSGGGLEEVYEDEYENDGGHMRGNIGADRGYENDDASLDMDDLQQQRGGGRGGGAGGDDADDLPQRHHGKHHHHKHHAASGGMELDDEADGGGNGADMDADLMAEMEANGAELDLDYHPPPPKTTQQVALAGVALILLGSLEMFLFAYMSTASEVWSLVASASALFVCGLLAIRAASDSGITTGMHYRFSLQCYIVLLLVLATINLIVLNVQPCIAPCISANPDDCKVPRGATQPCAYVLVNTISVVAFGLFFPIFLLCLPCYLGSGIHLENLQAQAALKHPAQHQQPQQESQKLMYRNNPDAEERKY